MNFCGSSNALCRDGEPALRRPPYPAMLRRRAATPDTSSSTSATAWPALANSPSFGRRRDGPVRRVRIDRTQPGIGDAGVPVTFVLDADGLIAARFDGAVTQPQLTAVTDALAKENGGLYVSHLEFIAGIRQVTAEGRRLTIQWDNLRCGDYSDSLGAVQVRQNVRAVHLEVVVKPNPKLGNFAVNCLPGRVPATTTVTLAAPLGSRLLLNAFTDVPIAVVRSR